MSSMDKTMKFDFSGRTDGRKCPGSTNVRIRSIAEKGYNPINQIVGYLLLGTHLYSRHKDARNLIPAVWSAMRLWNNW